MWLYTMNSLCELHNGWVNSKQQQKWNKKKKQNTVNQNSTLIV